MTRMSLAISLAALLLAPASLAQDAPDAETVARWLRDLSSEDYQTRQAATEHLIDGGPGALPAILAAGESSDAEVRFRVRFIAGEIRRRLEPPVDQVRVLVRDALERLTSKDSFGTGDPEYMEIVYAGRPAIPHLVELLAELEPEHVKRIYAGAALAQIAEAQDLPTVLAYLSDTNIHVRIHAGNSVQQLTGKSFEYDSSAGPENWSKARESYEEWWKENGERILEESRKSDTPSSSRSGPSTRTGGR